MSHAQWITLGLAFIGGFAGAMFRGWLRARRVHKMVRQLQVDAPKQGDM